MSSASPSTTPTWAHRNLAASSEHDHTLDPIRVERRDHAGDALIKVMANDDDRAIVSRQVAQGQTVHRAGCNRRYLEYLSSLDDFSAGIRALDRLTQPRPVNGRNLKGVNFFSRVEQSLLAALQRPRFNIAGLRRADLRPLLTQCSPATLSRQLARLRQLGVIKRVTGTYRYYLTRAGRAAIAAGRRLTEQTIIPALA